MRYLHLFIDGEEGAVTTVAITRDGYSRFDDRSVEYSIQDLKDIISEAEFTLDNAYEDSIDLDDEDDWWDDLYDDLDRDIDNF